MYIMYLYVIDINKVIYYFNNRCIKENSLLLYFLKKYNFFNEYVCNLYNILKFICEYIYKNNLINSNPYIINCDNELQLLFECKYMNIEYLKTFIINQCNDVKYTNFNVIKFIKSNGIQYDDLFTSCYNVINHQNYLKLNDDINIINFHFKNDVIENLIYINDCNSSLIYKKNTNIIDMNISINILKTYNILYKYIYINSYKIKFPIWGDENCFIYKSMIYYYENILNFNFKLYYNIEYINDIVQDDNIEYATLRNKLKIFLTKYLQNNIYIIGNCVLNNYIKSDFLYNQLDYVLYYTFKDNLINKINLKCIICKNNSYLFNFCNYCFKNKHV